MEHRLFRTEVVLTSSRPGSCTSAASEAAPPTARLTAPAASVTTRLRHPGPQHEVQPPRTLQQGSEPSLDPQSQRVVSLLLKELAAARKQEAAAAAELAQVKGELSAARQLGDRERRRESGSGGGRGVAAAGPPRPSPAAAASAGSRTIPAFRPAGQAPPPLLRQAKGRPQAAKLQPPPAAPTNLKGSQGDVQALRQDNAELCSQLEALYAHCRRLQRQLGAADAAAKSPPSAGAATAGGPAGQAAVGAQVRPAQLDIQRQPACGASPQRSQRAQRTGEQEGSTVLAAVVCTSPRRAHSPARISAAVVRSPAAGGCVDELAMAVFAPAPEDVDGLRLALNREQRQNLKLSSKLAKARDEAAAKAAEARRWAAAVEQQEGQLAELRVALEAERRQRFEAQQALAASQGEGAAAQEDAAALLGQLRAAEAMASAVEGEAACVRGQLAVAEEALQRARREVERLKEEAAATAARLSATDLVRREAERERDELELSNQRLRAALSDAEAGGSAAEQQLAAALAKAQQELAVEKQRGEMLQAQAALAEAQGRETERILTEQLRAVQARSREGMPLSAAAEERNACLAAATRADALLAKLGQHAMLTRGVD